MTVEAATYISQLNAALPDGTDPKSEGDNHLRLLKSVLQATLPNVTGAVTPTHTELNYVDGVTSAIQTQLDGKIASDSDLAAIAALSTSGLIARTGSGTAATRTITAPAAGITVTNGDGVAGNPTLVLANDLAALEGLASTGMIARTGDGMAAVRTITAGAGCTIGNGDGVAGNPTVSLTPGVGLGDVLGPAGATSNNVALFDGATGKIIKESALKTVGGVSILGAGDITTGLTRVEVSPTTQTATTGNDYWLENVAATAVTAPASTNAYRFKVTPANGLLTNTIDFGAATVRGPAGTMTGILNMELGLPMEFEYSSTLTQWVWL